MIDADVSNTKQMPGVRKKFPDMQSNKDSASGHG
jgi:hypothetical protein